MKTYTAKPADIVKKWFVIDAENAVLGRLAVTVANLLRGKHKTTFTPHLDCGDNVIVVNAEKVKVTGKKLTDKVFYWHTGYAGGIKGRTMGETLSGAHPERAILKAVERMVPRGPLGRQQMRNLRVYKGAAHPHEAQQPEALDLAARNAKNMRAH
jgi:large subunit ribosomal protein L13